jgi:hypothetical protein
MKNIDKYKTPQDKIKAWRKWAKSESGCKMCELNMADKIEATAYLREVINNPRTCISPPILLCDKTACFNAWLHSTTEKNNEK